MSRSILQLKHVVEVSKVVQDRNKFGHKSSTFNAPTTHNGFAYRAGADGGAFIDRGIDLTTQVDEIKVLLDEGLAGVDDKVRVLDRVGTVLYDGYQVAQVSRRPGWVDTLICRKSK